MMHGPIVRTQELKRGMLVQLPGTDLWAHVLTVVEQPNHRGLVYFTDREYAPVDTNMLTLWAYFDEGKYPICV